MAPSSDDHRIEDLLISRLDKLENKVDKIIPELAVIVERNRSSSKIHSTIAGTLAIFLSVLIERLNR